MLDLSAIASYKRDQLIQEADAHRLLAQVRDTSPLHSAWRFQAPNFENLRGLAEELTLTTALAHAHTLGRVLGHHAGADTESVLVCRFDLAMHRATGHRRS